LNFFWNNPIFSREHYIKIFLDREGDRTISQSIYNGRCRWRRSQRAVLNLVRSRPLRLTPVFSEMTSQIDKSPENSHVYVPKYRCPRCSTRTCSLQCSRRHKKWSQCSGVRDPASYLRRSELATPTAFDRDFNFITGIERGLERAERDAEDHGIPMDHDYACSLEGKRSDHRTAGQRSQRRKRAGNSSVGEDDAFLRRVQATGTNLIRAPKGMTRSRQNGSRWNSK
jgi:hypothetical protein